MLSHSLLSSDSNRKLFLLIIILHESDLGIYTTTATEFNGRNNCQLDSVVHPTDKHIIFQ